MSAAKLASTTDTAISRKIALQERVVAAVERLHRQRAEAGPAEHDLGRDRPGDDVAEVDRDQRDHRQQGVRERVLVEDAAVRQALRPRRRDVVLRPGLDDRRTASGSSTRRSARARPRSAAARGGGARSSAASIGVLSPPGVVIPEVGNQPRPDANTMISGMPITKYGIEYRTRLIPLPTRSIPPPRFQPDLAPIHSPMTIATASPRPISSTVGPTASNRTSVTGAPRYLIEYPRSPCAVDSMYDDQLVREDAACRARSGPAARR